MRRESSVALLQVFGKFLSKRGKCAALCCKQVEIPAQEYIPWSNRERMLLWREKGIAFKIGGDKHNPNGCKLAHTLVLTAVKVHKGGCFIQ